MDDILSRPRKLVEDIPIACDVPAKFVSVRSMSALQLERMISLLAELYSCSLLRTPISKHEDDGNDHQSHRDNGANDNSCDRAYSYAVIS